MSSSATVLEQLEALAFVRGAGVVAYQRGLREELQIALCIVHLASRVHREAAYSELEPRACAVDLARYAARELLERTAVRCGGTPTAEAIAAQRVSPEGQEGLKAFLEKRTPAWTAK